MSCSAICRPRLAGGEITLDVAASRAAVQTVADAMGLPSAEAAAAGIIDIVNENMLGGLRLVSVQQGFDPRDFALVAFGGAGPLHANAMGVLTGAWPVIVPPSPGVLCALGDATTSLRDEAARTCLRRFADLTGAELREILTDLADSASARLVSQGLKADGADRRVRGRRPLLRPGLRDPDHRQRSSCWTTWTRWATSFDVEHERLFSFLLGTDHELVNARASVSGPRPEIAATLLEQGDGIRRRRRPGRRRSTSRASSPTPPSTTD